MNTVPNQLSQEAARSTEALAGKIVARVERHRASEVLIEFTDGTRLFMDGATQGLEVSSLEVANRIARRSTKKSSRAKVLRRRA